MAVDFGWGKLMKIPQSFKPLEFFFYFYLSNDEKPDLMKNLLPCLPVFLILFLSACSPKQDLPGQPNVLFAFADDWGKYASCYSEQEGSEAWQSLVKTPNIDRI